MANRHNRRLLQPSVLLLGLLACVWQRAAVAALPPAVGSEPAPTTGSAQPVEKIDLQLPSFRFDGRLSYDARRDTWSGSTASQQAAKVTLGVQADAPIWRPWFGKLTGRIEFTAYRDSAQSNSISGSDSVSGRSVLAVGSARLTLFPMSTFPFEAHFDRSDSRTSTVLSALDGYSSQTVGFSQNNRWNGGNLMVGADRRSQTSLVDAYRQDVLQMALSFTPAPSHSVQVNAQGQRNRRENTGEFSEQNTLYALHSFNPSFEFGLQNTLDLIRSRYLLAQQGQPQSSQSSNTSRQLQLNSYGVWRPQGKPYSGQAGVRLLTFNSDWDSGATDASSVGALMRSFNVNAAGTYTVSPALNLNAGANVNLTNSAGKQEITTSQMVGFNYVPATIALGPYQYGWTTGSSLTNRTDHDDAGRQLIVQLGHTLSRNIEVGQGATLSAQISQQGSATGDSARGHTRELTHSGVLSYSTSMGAASTLLQLSAHDARSWGLNPSFFQMVNAQATGNLRTGRFSSWSGSLTIQTTRQRYGLAFDPNHPDSVIMVDNGDGFVTTSSGSLGYQNGQVFGVPRLVFFSDLRLNGQALLPLLGGPIEQETAAWENRLEYTIGRVFLRFNTRAGKTGGNWNRSLLFTVTRDLGG